MTRWQHPYRKLWVLKYDILRGQKPFCKQNSETTYILFFSLRCLDEVHQIQNPDSYQDSFRVNSNIIALLKSFCDSSGFQIFYTFSLVVFIFICTFAEVFILQHFFNNRKTINMKKMLFSATFSLAFAFNVCAQDATVTINTNGGTQKIPKEIYGQFSEHLGSLFRPVNKSTLQFIS